jgi:hypothetical protein
MILKNIGLKVRSVSPNTSRNKLQGRTRRVARGELQITLRFLCLEANRVKCCEIPDPTAGFTWSPTDFSSSELKSLSSFPLFPGLYFPVLKIGTLLFEIHLSRSYDSLSSPALLQLPFTVSLAPHNRRWTDRGFAAPPPRTPHPCRCYHWSASGYHPCRNCRRKLCAWMIPPPPFQVPKL